MLLETLPKIIYEWQDNEFEKEIPERALLDLPYVVESEHWDTRERYTRAAFSALATKNTEKLAALSTMAHDLITKDTLSDDEELKLDSLSSS